MFSVFRRLHPIRAMSASSEPAKRAGPVVLLCTIALAVVGSAIDVVETFSLLAVVYGGAAGVTACTVLLAFGARHEERCREPRRRWAVSCWRRLDGCRCRCVLRGRGCSVGTGRPRSHGCRPWTVRSVRIGPASHRQRLDESSLVTQQTRNSARWALSCALSSEFYHDHGTPFARAVS